MLGEQIIHDERGKVVGTRVLPSQLGQGPKMELTFQTTGKVLGMDFNNTGTLVSVPKSEGVLYVKGQGVVMTKDGGAATWTTQGVGQPTGPNMAASIRGTVLFETSSPALFPNSRGQLRLSLGWREQHGAVSESSEREAVVHDGVQTRAGWAGAPW